MSTPRHTRTELLARLALSGLDLLPSSPSRQTVLPQHPAVPDGQGSQRLIRRRSHQTLTTNGSHTVALRLSHGSPVPDRSSS